MGGETTLQERQKCESVQREPCFSCMAHVQREQLRGTYNMLIDVAYTGIVTIGVKVKSTPAPVTIALSMCMTTEPVEGRDEVFPV